jgi:hypothetical protein
MKFARALICAADGGFFLDGVFFIHVGKLDPVLA